MRPAYRHALDHPIDAPPLRELVRPGERVTIAVSDITRAWQRNDLTLAILLETLNAAGVVGREHNHCDRRRRASC